MRTCKVRPTRIGAGLRKSVFGKAGARLNAIGVDWHIQVCRLADGERLRGQCRRTMASAFIEKAKRNGKRRQRNGHQHAACPFGQQSARLFRLRQSAGRACLDRAVSQCGDDGGAQPEIHLRHARHADHRRACQRHRRAGRLGRHDCRALGPGGGDGAAARLPVGGRPCPDRQFRLSPDPQFRRHDAETAGRRGRILRSACRRRHRCADQAKHQGRVHRIAGLQHFRGAGHTGHRQGGACRRRRS